MTKQEKREWHREWYKKNEGKVKKYRAKYREVNKEKEKKREHECYKNNKAEHKRRQIRSYVRTKSVLDQIKSVGCYFCPEKDVDVLEFAHIDNKNKRRVPTTWFNGFLKEVEKCEVMCPTCHKKFDLGKLKLDKALSKKVKND